jgi:peptidoglycan/xylan/chitin deacetylase (PgdA/CDA1 family)
MYHGIPRQGSSEDVNADIFELHIQFLVKHFAFVHPSQKIGIRRRLQRPRILLTFDDGFRNNAEVAVPILRKYDVPAIFFVSSYHSAPGKYLWFAYLRALVQFYPEDGFMFRGQYMDMTASNRRETGERLWGQLLRLPNHPNDMYDAIEHELPCLEEFISSEQLQDRFSGMSEAQVRDIALDPLFSVGIHTNSHPFLTKCDPIESIKQILDNKRWLENAMGRPCNTVAYPIGDYNENIIQQCRDLDIQQGFAVAPSIRSSENFEIPRIGVYSPSTNVLGVKVQWGRAMRLLRMKVG